MDPTEPTDFQHYAAFISYRRKDSAGLARWIRDRLQRYKLPSAILKELPLEKKALHEQRPRVWLDKAFEKPSDDFLTRKIYPALDQSDRLIVISTPSVFDTVPGKDGTEEPNWLVREIDRFLKDDEVTKSPRPVDLVLGPGGSEDRFPGGLAEKERWDWIDFRRYNWWRSLGLSEELDVGLTKLVAGLYDIPEAQLPALRQEERQRRNRLLLGLIAFASIVALVIGGLGLYARHQQIIASEALGKAKTTLQKMMYDRSLRSSADGQNQIALHELITALQYGDNPEYRGRFLTVAQSVPQVLWETDAPMLVHSFAISPNGKKLATSIHQKVRLWDLPNITSNDEYSLPYTPDKIDFSYDGTQIFLQNPPSNFASLSVTDGKVKQFKSKRLESSIARMTSPDGSFLFAFLRGKGGTNGDKLSMYVTSLRTGEETFASTGDKTPIYASFGKNNDIYLAWGDHTVTVHKPMDLTNPVRILQVDGDISALTLREVSSRTELLIGLESGEVISVQPEGQTASFLKQASPIKILAAANFAPRVLIVPEDGRVMMWDLQRREILWKSKLNEDVREAAISADGRYTFLLLEDRRPTKAYYTHSGLPTGAGNYPLLVLDEHGKQLTTADDRFATVMSFSEDGSALVYAQGNSLVVRHARTGVRQALHERLCKGRIVGLTTASDLAFTVSVDGEVACVDLHNGQHQIIAQSELHGNLLRIAVAKDGSLLAVASGEGKLQFLERDSKSISPVITIAQQGQIHDPDKGEMSNLNSLRFNDLEQASSPFIRFVSDKELFLITDSGLSLISVAKRQIIDWKPVQWNSGGLNNQLFVLWQDEPVGAWIADRNRVTEVKFTKNGLQTTSEGVNEYFTGNVMASAFPYYALVKDNPIGARLGHLPAGNSIMPLPEGQNLGYHSVTVHRSGLVAFALEDGRIRVANAAPLRWLNPKGLGNFAVGLSHAIWWPGSPAGFLVGKTEPGGLIVDPETETVTGILSGPKSIPLPSGTPLNKFPISGERYSWKGQLWYLTSLTGRWLVSYEENKEGYSVNVWDQLTNSGPTKIAINIKGINGRGFFVEDSQLYITGDEDGRIFVLDLEKGEVSKVIDSDTGDPSFVTLTKDKKQIVVGYDSGHLRYIDAATHTTLRWAQPHSRQITGLTLFGDKGISASDDGTLIIWDGQFTSPTTTVNLIRINALTISEKRKLIAVIVSTKPATGPGIGVKDMRLAILNEKAERLAVTTPVDLRMDSLTFDPSGRYLAVVTYDEGLLIWDLEHAVSPVEVLKNAVIDWTRLDHKSDTEFMPRHTPSQNLKGRGSAPLPIRNTTSTQ